MNLEENKEGYVRGFGGRKGKEKKKKKKEISKVKGNNLKVPVLLKIFKIKYSTSYMFSMWRILNFILGHFT